MIYISRVSDTFACIDFENMFKFAGRKIGLMWKGEAVAVLDVESRWVPDKAKETKRCYGTSSLEHPGVQMVAMERGHTYVGLPLAPYSGCYLT